MVKIVDKQNIFNAGIISPKLYSRDDLKQYNNGIADGINFICSRYGPMEKRVGTKFVWDLENPDEEVFFLPFVFSIKQAILLEFLNNKIKFYTFDGIEFGPVVDPGITWINKEQEVFKVYTKTDIPEVGDKVYSTSEATEEIGTITEILETEGSPLQIILDTDITYTKQKIQYEISTPFTKDQLKDIAYVQSLDVLYLAFADGKTPPYTLSRYSTDNWKLEIFETEDGPYLDQNYSASKTITLDKNTDETIDAVLTNFKLGQEDVGRWIRINTTRYNEQTYVYEDKWSYGKISAVNEDGTKINIKWDFRNIVKEEDQTWMTEPTSAWRLGAWHPATSNTKDYPVTYPTKVSIHQQRLVWAGITNKPWVWTSNTFSYKNYAPSDYEGNITDSNSINADISTDKVSDIFWLKSVKSLLIGTELGEIRMYSAGTAITPSDYVTNRESSYGAYNGEPIVTDDMIIFIQRLQRTLRSLSYDYNSDAFVGPELTVLSEQLTAGGIKKIVFQKEPNNTIWGLREDGELLTLTYDKAQDVIGWSQCKLAGTDTKVIDLAVLPSNDYQQDMVLFAVERTINGEKKRYLELLSKNFTEDVKQKDACFLDCATNIQSEEAFNTLEGLDFLEGEVVRVMDEGAYLGDYPVVEGKITLEYPCKDIWVGLPYEAYFETLERDFNDKQLSTRIASLRIYKLRLYLNRTLGLTLKRLDNGGATTLVSFNPGSLTDTPPELITGKTDVKVPSAWDCDYRLRIDSEPGLPCTVAGIIIGLEINAI